MSDNLDWLDEVAKRHESWKPEKPGDGIAGEIVAIGSYDGGYGEYPIYTIRRKNGETFAVHAYHSQLRGMLADHGARVGDHFGIRFDGDGKTRDGRPTYNYTVGPIPGVQRATTPPDDEPF